MIYSDAGYGFHHEESSFALRATTRQARRTQKGRKVKFDRLSNQVIGCAIEVHRNLGPGLLESTYEQCLAHELRLSDIPSNGIINLNLSSMITANTVLGKNRNQPQTIPDEQECET
jgi:hypothetical protein